MEARVTQLVEGCENRRDWLRRRKENAATFSASEVESRNLRTIRSATVAELSRSNQKSCFRSCKYVRMILYYCTKSGAAKISSPQKDGGKLNIQVKRGAVWGLSRAEGTPVITIWTRKKDVSIPVLLYHLIRIPCRSERTKS